MRDSIDSMRGYLAAIPARERHLVLGAMALGFAAVAAYVLLTRSHALAGDEAEYHSYGVFFTEGNWWWSTTPFDIARPSAWKAPLYPLWVGALYTVVGDSPLRVELIQAALLAPLTVGLAWALARRLFDPRVAVATAFVTALFPLAFEYFGLLFPEALAIPLTLAALLLFMSATPTTGRTVAVGALIGVGLLARPTSLFLLGGAAAAWIVAAGWRTGLGYALLAGVVAALVVAPWTIRNVVTDDVGFVPISVQDAAAYGTFNDTAAGDDEEPYRWRAVYPGVAELLDLEHPVSDAKLRSRLQDAAVDYIREHPESIPKALYYNGITRFWDLRPPGDAVDEADFQGRSAAVRTVGLAIYYPLAALALLGLWQQRRRRELVVPLLTMALLATLAFTIVSGTRYRAPFEPLIAMLACSVLVGFIRPRRTAGADDL